MHPADWVLTPAVKVVRAVPVASFIVLVLLWAPTTGVVPAIVSALMVLPVLWGNVGKGISQTDPQLLELAKAYRFGRAKTMRLIYIPSVLPYFASGCATALGLAWKAGVAADKIWSMATQWSSTYSQSRTFSPWPYTGSGLSARALAIIRGISFSGNW